MRIDEVQTDIRKFVYKRMQEDHRFAKWPEGLRREVGDKLAVGANGMCGLIFPPLMAKQVTHAHTQYCNQVPLGSLPA